MVSSIFKGLAPPAMDGVTNDGEKKRLAPSHYYRVNDKVVTDTLDDKRLYQYYLAPQGLI